MKTSKRSPTNSWRPITNQWWHAFLYCLTGYVPKVVGKCLIEGVHYDTYVGEDLTRYILDKETGKIWITRERIQKEVAHAEA